MKNRKFLVLILSVLLAICLIMCVACTTETNSEKNNNQTLTSVVADDDTISLNTNKVVLNTGDSYTVTATTSGNIALDWSIDGNADETVVSLSRNGNSVKINALKEGNTILIASFEKDGKLYYRAVSVQVNVKNDVAIVLNGEIEMGDYGYYIDLATIADAGDDTTAQLAGSVYKDNVIQNNISLTFTSADENVVQIINGKAQSVTYGSTTITAKCIVDEKEYSVDIAVNVYKPSILCLDELPVIEVENLQTITLPIKISGNTEEVMLDGKVVGEYNKFNNQITFVKSKLPTSSKELGEDRFLSLTTEKATYEFVVDVYTKIISTKADLDEMAQISKACSTNSAIWDGYFVLANNIDYSGVYTSAIANQNTLWSVVEGQWSYGGLYGFKGVFDGKNYNINGLEINCGNKKEAWGTTTQEMGGLFGLTNIEGVIKNVSFTHAKVSANTSFLTSAGGGTVENVYIQFDEIGTGTERSASSGQYCGAFFSYKEPIHTATVRNCVVDLTDATINSGIKYVMCGSNPTVKSNVIIIGGTEEIRLNSNANYSFETNTEFVENDAIQKKYRDEEKFDSAFWSKVGGVPISNAQYELVKNNTVSVTNKPTTLTAGQTYTFTLSNRYASVTCYSQDVTIKNNIATISEDITVGTKLTFYAISYLNSSIVDTFTVTIGE